MDLFMTLTSLTEYTARWSVFCSRRQRIIIATGSVVAPHRLGASRLRTSATYSLAILPHLLQCTSHSSLTLNSHVTVTVTGQIVHWLSCGAKLPLHTSRSSSSTQKDGRKARGSRLHTDRLQSSVPLRVLQISDRALVWSLFIGSFFRSLACDAFFMVALNQFIR